MELLDVFAKLWNAIISFVVSVRLFAWNSVAPTGWSVMKFNILGFFESQEN